MATQDFSTTTVGVIVLSLVTGLASIVIWEVAKQL